MVKTVLDISCQCFRCEAFRETGIVIKPYQPAIFHRLSIIQPASGPSSPVVLDFIDTFIESLQPFTANSTAILKCLHPHNHKVSITPLSRIDFAA